MPRPSAQLSRLVCLVAGAALSLLTACSGGGGGGGGGTAPASTASSGQTTNITVAWSDANGPVAGYSVYVQRDAGAVKHEQDVSSPRVTLSGAPGSTARVIVVAFDALRRQGPNSPSSPLFTFPAVGQSAAAANAGVVAGTQQSVSMSSQAAASASSALASSAPAQPADPAEELAPDLPGTLVWEAGDALRLTDTALATKRIFTRPAEGAQLAAAADFDADGQTDLLWVGTSAELGYTSGGALRSADPISLVAFGALAPGERVIGAGDFDGDGDGDVLVASGDAVRAQLTAPDGAPAIAELGSAAQAALAGIADFDANGSEDIAWRSSTGALVLWLMNGGNLGASVEMSLGGGLGVMGVGDFDGGGEAEVALRGPNGDLYLVDPVAASPALERSGLASAATWRSVGAGDLDGDGLDELVMAMAAAIRIAGSSGDQVHELDPDAPWQLVALLP